MKGQAICKKIHWFLRQRAQAPCYEVNPTLNIAWAPKWHLRVKGRVVWLTFEQTNFARPGVPPKFSKTERMHAKATLRGVKGYLGKGKLLKNGLTLSIKF